LDAIGILNRRQLAGIPFFLVLEIGEIFLGKRPLQNGEDERRESQGAGRRAEVLDDESAEDCQNVNGLWRRLLRK